MLILERRSRFLQSIIDELARTVEFSYGASSNLGNLTQPKMMGSFEDGIEVTYDFGLLVNNRYLRNLLIETTDGYIDLNRMHYQICASIREIGEHLAEQGID